MMLVSIIELPFTSTKHEIIVPNRECVVFWGRPWRLKGSKNEANHGVLHLGDTELASLVKDKCANAGNRRSLGSI